MWRHVFNVPGFWHVENVPGVRHVENVPPLSLGAEKLSVDRLGKWRENQFLAAVRAFPFVAHLPLLIAQPPAATGTPEMGERLLLLGQPLPDHVDSVSQGDDDRNDH